MMNYLLSRQHKIIHQGFIFQSQNLQNRHRLPPLQWSSQIAFSLTLPWVPGTVQCQEAPNHNLNLRAHYVTLPNMYLLYLPHLQSLEFTCESDFPWKSLLKIFALPCWQSLRVRVTPQFGLGVGDDLKLLLELHNKGFDFCIGKDGEDWLQKYIQH